MTTNPAVDKATNIQPVENALKTLFSEIQERKLFILLKVIDVYHEKPMLLKVYSKTQQLVDEQVYSAVTS